MSIVSFFILLMSVQANNRRPQDQVTAGEEDDKIIAVLNDDKRMNHIKTVEDLGEHMQKELAYYFEHYKDLKKPGTGEVKGFFGSEEAHKIISECEGRYNTDYAPKRMPNGGRYQY